MALQQGLEQAHAQPLGRVRLSKQARREEREFYLFILPWIIGFILFDACLLYTSPSPRDRQKSRMPSSA